MFNPKASIRGSNPASVHGKKKGDGSHRPFFANKHAPSIKIRLVLGDYLAQSGVNRLFGHYYPQDNVSDDAATHKNGKQQKQNPNNRGIDAKIVAQATTHTGKPTIISCANQLFVTVRHVSPPNL